LASSERFGILRGEVTVRYTALVLVVLLVSAGVIVRVYDVRGGDERSSAVGADVAHAHVNPRPPRYATAWSPVRLHPRFKHPPRAGMLFDVDSGRVLWARHAYARAPIASLAKIMTAILVDQRSVGRERVLITERPRPSPARPSACWRRIAGSGSGC
jgi:D-alanyl-D-alanine carboxypeptidase